MMDHTDTNKHPHRISLGLASITIIGMAFVWSLFFLYINPQTIGADQFQMLESYGKIHEGVVGWSQLWYSKGGHRAPGYILTLFANVSLFKFQPLIEIFISLAALCLMAALSYRIFIKEADHSGAANKWLWGSFAVLMTLILFSSQTMWLSLYSVIAMRIPDYLGFVLVALFFYSLVARTRPLNSLSWLYLALALAFMLIFGRGWAASAIAAMGGALGLYALTTGEWRMPKQWRPYLIFGGWVFLYIGLYFYNMSFGIYDTPSPEIGTKAKFFVRKIGSSIIGMGVEKTSAHPILTFYTGLLFLALSLILISWNLIDKKINRAIYLATFMVLFSIVAALTLGWSRGGSAGFFNPSPFFARHNLEISIGALGLCYLAAIRISDLNIPVLKYAISAVFIAMIFSLGISSKTTFQTREVLRKSQTIKTVRVIYLIENEGSREEYHKVWCRIGVERCRQVFKMMDTYGLRDNLSVPADVEIISDAERVHRQELKLQKIAARRKRQKEAAERQKRRKDAAEKKKHRQQRSERQNQDQSQSQRKSGSNE